MKNFLLSFALLLSVSAFSQFSIGYYGLHNMNNNFREGWGFGMNGLSSPKLKLSPVKIQYGAGYSILWAGQKTFDDVVFADGQSPLDISFVNMRTNIHGIFRVSVPSSSGKFVPYAELSPGIAYNNSSVDIHDKLNEDNCNSYSAANSTGFNLGASAGILFQLNKMLAVDAGMAWNSDQKPVNMIAMNSVNVSDGISYGMKAAPSTVVCFRIGIRVSIDNSGCCSVENCTIRSHHKTCGATHLPH